MVTKTNGFLWLPIRLAVVCKVVTCWEGHSWGECLLLDGSPHSQTFNLNLSSLSFFTVTYLFIRSLKSSFSLVGRDNRIFWAGWALMLDSLKKAATKY